MIDSHKPSNPFARVAGLTQITKSKLTSGQYSEIVPEHLYQSYLPTSTILSDLKPTSVIDCRWLIDGPLPEDMSRLSALANSVAYMVRNGERVLVHCEAGINRSSLVICLVLLRLYPDWSGAQAVRYLETKRTLVLTNQIFRKYLTTLQPLGNFDSLISGDISP